MRKLIFMLVGLVVLAGVVPAMAAHTDGGCAGCHSAHNSDPDSDPNGTTILAGVDIPLWAGNLAVGSTFTPYDDASSTIQATIGDPDGSSLMCLSCHDGSGSGVSGTHDLGTDLSNSHPISFEYNTALSVADTGLENPSVKEVPAGGTIDAEWLDSNDKIQCATCHDVHAMHTDAALRVDNTTGALCKTCHKK